MTRLVVAHPHFTYPGGASEVALETGNLLAKRGYDVHVVSLQSLDELVSPYPALTFHDLGGPLSSEFRYWATLPLHHRRFGRLVDSLKPDAILTHVFPANYWAFVYRKRRVDIPCIWYCHEPSAFVHDWRVISGVSWPMRAGVLLANPVLQIVDRVLARSADQIVTNSRFSAERIQRVYRQQSTVAYPGTRPVATGPHHSSEPLFIAVGRVTAFKRFDLLLGAAEKLKVRGRSAQIVIIGDGESLSDLKKYARERGLDDVVSFAGRVSRDVLDDHYRRALAVVVTSDAEPFGLVPVEAMRHGAAVICSDRGGPTETVRDGETGLYFKSGDASDLAAKMSVLLDNPATAQAMGEAGRLIAEDVFTWERTTDGIQSTLNALLLSNECGVRTSIV